KAVDFSLTPSIFSSSPLLNPFDEAFKEESVIFRFGLIVICSVAFAALGSAQESETINKSLIPIQANDLNKFVPRGWKIEKKLTADLNGDSSPDFALKLIENKPEKDQGGDPTERSRALVIVLQNQDGKLTRAGLADKLLHCTRCR